MYIVNSYYVKREDNCIWLQAGLEPDPKDEIIEERPILNAEEDMDLIRIADDENIGSSIWLRNGDVQENYREEKHEEPPMEV